MNAELIEQRTALADAVARCTGYTRGMKCERIYREVKVMMIGGGTEEIMKELAARQIGL